MLVLTRKQGERLRIGNDNKITVCVIYKTQIKLEINDSEVITLDLQESISIADDIKISLEEIKKSHVQIGIVAPKDVKIDREEERKDREMKNEELTSEQMNNTFDEIFKQTDRASALVSCALLDELLERLLLAFFMEHGNAKKDLFDGMTPLSSMSAKINIAYYMGLIEQYIFVDLTLIRKIRNDFAHSFETINFETQHIKNRCTQLKMLINSEPPKMLIDNIKNTKMFFQINTTMLASELLFRIIHIKRLEPFQYRKEEGVKEEGKSSLGNLLFSLKENKAKIEKKKG